MSIPLQSSFVYGPVDSRRLGRSLGINILPSDTKFCLSNCLYCQYGATNLRAVRMVKLPPVDPIIEELGRVLSDLVKRAVPLDAITFSGNGEPTLHPELEDLVDAVKKLRDLHFPNARVGILSDSSRVHLPSVRKVLEKMDDRFMKLDAGDPETYRKINQPLGAGDWNEMISGLKLLSSVTIQSMFISGPVCNAEGDVFESWVSAVKKIAPQSVHVYTIDRPAADSRVKSVSKEKLESIARRVTSEIGCRVDCFENRHEDRVGFSS